MSLVKMCKDETPNFSFKISEIHFTPIRPRSGLIGFVSFVLNDSFSVSGVGVHTRFDREGIRLLYPTKQISDGSVLNLFHPVKKIAGEAVEQAVWEKLKPLYQNGVGDALP